VVISIRRARALVLTVSVFVTAGIAAAAGGFPPSIYPSPVAAVPGHALALCPNRQGLDPFTSPAVRLALRAAASYGRQNLDTDLRNSDRAWWPQVRRMWRTGRPGTGLSNHVVLGSESTAQSAFAVFMGPACGSTTLRKSLMVTVGPSQAGSAPHCSACNSHLFFINRRGRPLIYFLY
jgi:hypothetical protein